MSIVFLLIKGIYSHNMVYILQSFLLAAAVLFSWTNASAQTLPTCVNISSHSWSCWMNLGLLGAAGITPPEEFVEKAQKLVVD